MYLTKLRLKPKAGNKWFKKKLKKKNKHSFLNNYVLNRDI